MAEANKVKELLQGAIDVHVHTGPDVFPRLMDDIEAATRAKKAGMRAIIIKNHMTATAGRAQIASRVTGLPVFGGVVLNLPVGGINPHAVDAALKMGAKEIWMPTLHAAAYLSDGSHVPMFNSVLKAGTQGISIFDKEGDIRKEVLEVLDLIAAKDAILGTGHISPKEAMALVASAKRMGVKKIFVTHPLSTMLNYSIRDLKEIVEKGATMLEHNINDTTSQMKKPISFGLIAEAIMAVGPEKTIMASDGGQAANPSPVAMMESFISQMLDHGIKEKDVAAMVRDNPARMLEL